MKDQDRLDVADDAELLRRARDGEDPAFRVLVERYEPLVAGTVIGMLGRGPDAEEAGQETFIRFWRSLDRFRGESALGTWLTRIAMNVCLNQIRSRNRWTLRFTGPPPEERPDPGPTPAQVVDEKERSEAVQRAIGALRPEYRAVVVLRLVQGYSTAETAQALSIPTGTVLSRLSRAQSELRERLGDRYLP